MTAVDEFCKHDLLAITCSTCLHGPDTKRSRRFVAAGPEFIARWDGQCPACNLPIQVGRRVVMTTLGVYVHAPDCLDGP